MALNKILLQAYIQLSFLPLGRSQTQNNINVSIKQHLPIIRVYRIAVLFLTSHSSLMCSDKNIPILNTLDPHCQKLNIHGQ